MCLIIQPRVARRGLPWVTPTKWGAVDGDSGEKAGKSVFLLSHPALLKKEVKDHVTARESGGGRRIEGRTVSVPVPPPLPKIDDKTEALSWCAS